MKEIGGYFEFENLDGEEYYSDLIKLNTARNALLYILRARRIRKLYIPYFLCDCIRIMLERYGYAYEHYFINESFHPAFSGELAEGEYLYVVNYYGQLQPEVLLGLKNKYHNIIVDNVQAFFQKPVKDMDTIYSCRKFFGVPDGSYVYTNAVYPETLQKDTSAGRMRHLLGRYEESASAYYDDFKHVDDSFIEEELRLMSKISRNILRGINYRAVSEKRVENYAVLEKELKARNHLSLKKIQGPFCYPFYCPALIKDALHIRQMLAEQKVYIPTLWPNVLKEMPNTSLEYRYAMSILHLPCDQRYTKEDMLYLINILREYINF